MRIARVLALTAFLLSPALAANAPETHQGPPFSCQIGMWPTDGHGPVEYVCAANCKVPPDHMSLKAMIAAGLDRRIAKIMDADRPHEIASWRRMCNLAPHAH
jgi:hypothetical protein